jgi:hypothetical protein
MRLLRRALPRCLWGLVASAVAIVLVDLFFFRYRLIGPTVFGALCFLGGAALGRTPLYAAHFGSGSGAQRWGGLCVALVFLAIGIVGLSYPLRIDLPDRAPIMWGIWTPDGRHLGRYRMMQVFVGPAFLWMGSVFLAAAVRSVFARPRSQDHAGSDGGVSSPGADGSVPAGTHPWIYTLGLYGILVLVTLRMMLSS